MSHRLQLLATVKQNKAICREHYRLTLLAKAFPPTAPGQFLQIACRPPQNDHIDTPEFEWPSDGRDVEHAPDVDGAMAFLRRPFSLAGRRDAADGVELDFIHRVVGVGTDWLSELAIGDAVDLLGPLGNRFELPKNDEVAVLVGGGVGIPPMIYLANAISATQSIAFSGSTTRDLLALDVVAEADPAGVEPRACVREFSQSIISTDDGTYGFKGYVTQALERWLDTQKLVPRDRLRVYTCGPELMMKRVGQIAIDRNIPCQIAVERAMACGMGTCQSCCIRVKKPDPKLPPLAGNDWCYRLACTDGPIFQAADLLW